MSWYRETKRERKRVNFIEENSRDREKRCQLYDTQFLGDIYICICIYLCVCVCREILAENPLSTSPLSKDGKWGKASNRIMESHLEGIKRVEPVTSPIDHWGIYLTSGSRLLEITLEDDIYI
jgi:hypothetical protein